MQKKKILFIVDEGYPIESAPAVRIDSFLKEVRDQEILLLEGAREQRKEKNRCGLKRPSEKKIISFAYFLLKLNYTAMKLPPFSPYEGFTSQQSCGY